MTWPTCCGCKWWVPNPEHPYANFTTSIGRCVNGKLLFGRDTERIVIDTNDVFVPELYTGSAFGCVHWEPE